MAGSRKPAAAAADYKIGDTYDCPAGSIVLRPDGTAVTCSGGHVLNLEGEYEITDNKGKKSTVTAAKR